MDASGSNGTSQGKDWSQLVTDSFDDGLLDAVMGSDLDEASAQALQVVKDRLRARGADTVHDAVREDLAKRRRV